MNKRIISCLLFIWVITGITTAQSKESTKEERDKRRKENFEQFRAKRVAFITEKVKLTTEEAEIFWPICNELQEKKFELNKPLREERREIFRSKKALTEADYQKMIDTNADIKVKEAQLEKEYLAKFKKVLSAEKIFKYQRAEEEFMKQIFSHRGSKGDRPQGERRNTPAPARKQ